MSTNPIIPNEWKRIITNISKNLRVPVSTHTGSDFIKDIYQEIAKKIPNAPIPILTNPQNGFQHLSNSDYMNIPLQIRKEIESKFMSKTTVPKFFYKILLPKSRRQINIALWTTCNKTESILVAYKMIQWLYYLDEMLPLNPKCSHILTIYFYMTDHVKCIPKTKSVSVATRLTPVNVNSAFTYACTHKNHIVLFRKEEWFKVFIHESMHALGIDFSGSSNHNMSKITQYLLENTFRGVKSPDLRIYESYTELWAEIMNILISVFEITRRPRYDEMVKKRVETMIHMEMIWSLMQANKVLRFYNIPRYQKLLVHSPSRPIYQESCGNGNIDGGAAGADTCVFSYYILKSILYFYWKQFFSWCNCGKRQPTSQCILFDTSAPDTLESFTSFLCKCAKSKLYQQALDHVEEYMANHCVLDSNTMAMSIWGKYKTGYGR